MKILVLSINHGEQIAALKDELLIPEVLKKKEQLRARVRELIASRGLDLICEESDPCFLSVAQDEGFKADPRVPWKNINMTSQERLEAGIWEALLNRPYDTHFLDDHNAITIEHRIPEDEIREEFFTNEILKAANESGVRSIMVLCGDMHTDALKAKLEAAGHRVEANHELVPEKHWK